MNSMRGVKVNTSIVGHGVRNGVVQTGTAALLLGAVLAASGSAHAADTFSASDGDLRLADLRLAQVEAEEARAQAAVAAESAAQAAAAAQSEARAQADSARRVAQAEADSARKVAQAEADAARKAAQAEASKAKRDADENSEAAAKRDAELAKKLQDAQERLQQAAQEVAELSQTRARDAMERSKWGGFWSNSTRPVLGIQLDADRDDSQEGTRIEDVSPGGPAEQAGVRAGDVIVKVDGKDVRRKSTREVLELLRDLDVKKPVDLVVARNGKEIDFRVTPRVVSARVFVPPATIQPVPPVPNMESFKEFKEFEPFAFNFNFGGRRELNGLQVTPVTPQLGKYFGTDKGMLVLRAPNSELFKLQEGDVIVSIDGRVPTSGSHIGRILGSYQPGEKLTLRIMRDRKQQDLVVTLPEDTRRAARRERERNRVQTDEL